MPKLCLPVIAACLLLCAFPAFADNYPRQPGIDAQHYTFRVALTDTNDEVTGEAIVDLRFLQSGVTQVVLDLTSLKLDLEKAKAWMAKGAVASDRVHRFLSDAGVVKARVHNNPQKAKPRKKAQERAAAAAKAAEAPAA